MRLFKSLRDLLSNKKGNVLMLTAGAMPLLIGSAGLAVDTIQLSLLKRHLQRAADSGALAGAYARVQSKPVAAAVNRALGFNNAFPLSSSTIQTPPTSGPYANNDRTVRVILTARRALPFWSFFSSNLPVINVEATASLVFSGQYCMVSLDDGAGTGITFSGHSTVNVGCGVISNTSGAAAVYADGSATVTASPVAAVGGVPTSSVYRQPTLLLPYSLKQEDPYKDIPNPSPTLPCGEAITDSRPPTTGQYCYKGLDIDKAMTLDPGIYYITGPLTLNANANLTAHNVTLVLTSLTPSVPTSFPAVAINGNAKLDLTPPTSGTYEGIIMHYDGRAPTVDPGPRINGNSSSKFQGAFYFPSQKLTFNGNSNTDTNCIRLVAFRLTFEGNTTMNNSCHQDDDGTKFNVRWVRLVA